MVEAPLTLDREDRRIDATLVRPARGPLPHRAWVVFHGVTRPGIRHPQLVRFARALASTGAVVIVPEVPEWRELELAPALTLPTLRAALRGLRALPGAAHTRVGVVGFSFGAPQALVAASDASMGDEVAGVVAFGGYFDLARTIRFMFTGEHEWEDAPCEPLDPDPYGRWVVGANHLTVAPGFEDAGDVQRALHDLAAAAGDLGAPSDSYEYDPLKARLRVGIAKGRREVFDTFAPRAGRRPERDAALAMVDALVQGGRAIDPLMDPGPWLERARHPVHLLHGRGDRLIPYTESLRLAARLPPEAPCHLTITRLFAHTRGQRFPLASGPREAWAFFRALGGVIGVV